MRIVLTVPEDILREACNRITVFCKEHIVSAEKLKELSVMNEARVICESELTRAA